ncbi:hypothetical protein L2D01_03895 [Hyphomonadaceae bacterium ML37]|nr:hypothetical protein L2D01_03895 [Hyphomonadaceae bacterium ML37]
MNRRQVILFGVAGLLAVLVALDYARRSYWEQPEQPAVSSRVDGAPVADAGPFLPDFEAFDVIDQRPLFAASRRPPPRTLQEPSMPAPVMRAQDDVRPSFLISGVISGPDGLTVVLVREGGESRRIYAGETFNGWRIDSVNADSVIVTQGNSRWRLPVGQSD